MIIRFFFKSTALVFCWFEAQVSASGTFAAIIALEQDFDSILHTQFTAYHISYLFNSNSGSFSSLVQFVSADVNTVIK